MSGTTLEELAPGLRRWTAPHPEWTPEEAADGGWEREVACLAWEARDALVLIDPLVPVDGPDQQELWNELDATASRHRLPVAVVLTVFWHERSAGVVFERYSKTLGARIWAPRDAVDRIEGPVTDPFDPGATLPGGIEAFAAKDGEVVLWLPEPRALVTGDILLGTGAGLRLCPPSWVNGEERLEAARASLLGLLELPVEIVLPAHGPPVLTGARDALAAALRRGG